MTLRDPSRWDDSHVHLIIGVYRTAVALLVSGSFTAAAMAAELKRSFASGYRDDEVVDALAFLVRNGDLRTISAEEVAHAFYVPGPRWPVLTRGEG